jgi:hypothetical protein
MKVLGIMTTGALSLLFGIAAPAYGQHDQQGEKQDHDKQQQGKHEQARPEQQHAQQKQQPEQKQQQTQRAQQEPRQHEDQKQDGAGQRQSNQQQPQHAQQEPRQEQDRQQEHAQQKQSPQHRQSQHAQEPQYHNQQSQQARHRQDHQQPQRTHAQERRQHDAWHQHRSQSWASDHRTWQQRGGYNGYRIPEARFRGYFGENHGFRIYGRPFLVVGGYPRFQYSGYWFSMIDPWPESWADDWYDTDDVYVSYVDNGYYLHNRRYPTVGIAISISL